MKIQALSQRFYKKYNQNEVSKKYMFHLLTLLNRKIYGYAFLKIYGFKRVAIALHYYAKDINRIPLKKPKEEVKEILLRQNQSYSQGIISTLCKNKSYQALPTANSTNISSISSYSNKYKNI